MNLATPNTQNLRIYALIVAAGAGARAGGDVPKQYQPIAGKPMLRYACETLSRYPGIMGVLPVIHSDHHALYDAATEGLELLPVAFGGSERSDSVRAGLNALALYQPDYVLIHDAARPFLPGAVLDAIIEKLVAPAPVTSSVRVVLDGVSQPHSPDHAVVPVLPVADTVRRYQAGVWSEVPRDGLLRIQTPQAFAFAALKKLYEQEVVATDDAALWLAAGLPLMYVTGSEELRKMTTAEDMTADHTHARMRHGARRMAVGMGFDVHELMPSGKHVMRLGGIDIECEHKLHGHSDADVVLHAVADAIYGALAEGDIGAHFPPSDERLKGANSRMFTEHAAGRIAARGGVLQHMDVTIICEHPKVAPHRDRMRAAIAEQLGIPVAHVSVKATTTEKLGFTGREEGIAAQAVATLSLPEDI